MAVRTDPAQLSQVQAAAVQVFPVQAFHYLLLIFPLYLLKSINKYQLVIAYASGIVWDLILLACTKTGIILFFKIRFVIPVAVIYIFILCVLSVCACG